jgi:hypothetical protein
MSSTVSVKGVEEQLQHLTAYLSAAYRTIASIEKRVSATENELVQLEVKTAPLVPAVAAAHQRVSATPEGYEILEDNDGFYYWRRTREPLARAPFGEPTRDMARVQAAYHSLKLQHILRARGTPS